MNKLQDLSWNQDKKLQEEAIKYFSKDENPELLIRRGMNQYEDLVKHFKTMERKERKLSKASENTTPIKVGNEKKIEEQKENVKKLEFVENKEKKKDNEKEEKKIVEEKNDIKIQNVKEDSNVKLVDFMKEPEEGYEHSQIETSEYEISPEIKITAQWYYINKKKSKNEEIDEENKEEPNEEEKVCLCLLRKRVRSISRRN